MIGLAARTGLEKTRKKKNERKQSCAAAAEESEWGRVGVPSTALVNTGARHHCQRSGVASLAGAASGMGEQYSLSLSRSLPTVVKCPGVAQPFWSEFRITPNAQRRADRPIGRFGVRC